MMAEVQEVPLEVEVRKFEKSLRYYVPAPVKTLVNILKKLLDTNAVEVVCIDEKGNETPVKIVSIVHYKSGIVSLRFKPDKATCRRLVFKLSLRPPKNL